MKYRVLKAPSKVTLFLKVKRKTKKEKKHKIHGVFQKHYEISDVIYISKTKNKTLILYKNAKIKNCNILKAINFLKTKQKIPNYKIKVFKKIPLCSGIGGSATDCGAVIKYICEENKMSLSQKDMEEIAIKIGSDVPFFLFDFEVGEVSGYGEKVKEEKQKKEKINIVLTGIKTSVKKVYKQYDITPMRCKKNRNSLQSVAFEIYPKLEQKYKELEKRHKEVWLSGSGGSFITKD